MFWKGQNKGIFGNPKLNKISVTGKAMGPIESASEDWDLKLFDERTFQFINN